MGETIEGKKPVWMVWRTAFASDYRDPVSTYGPFATEEEARAFVENGGGTIYDDAALSFGEREVLGIWT